MWDVVDVVMTPEIPSDHVPWKKPFPAGTVARMDELLAAGGLRESERERVMCIRLLALDMKGPVVAEVIGRSANTVYRHKKNFLAEGEAALVNRDWGGRRNAALTPEQEAALVAGFQQAASDGKLVTASVIAEAMAEQAGRTVHPSTVSRLLKRRGWRKVVPRPTHPDADPERRAAFKETSPP